MRFRNHTYIHDGVMYQNYMFDQDGVHHKVADMWLMWQRKRPDAKPPVKVVKSFDDGYINNNVTDIRACGNHELVLLTTESNRKIWTGLDTKLITVDGPVPVRDLGIGAPLRTMDNYKNYYGDHIKLDTDGNSRARALLRNHNVPFTVTEHGGTQTIHHQIYVMDYDTSGVVENSGILTYGMNNYREGIKALYGLPDYASDPVVSIVPKKYTKYLVAVYVDGPQNVILQNGMVVQSAQTEVRHDW